MAKRALKVADLVEKSEEPATEVITEEPQGTRRRLTPEVRAEIMRELADGLSKKTISQKHGTSYTTIVNIEKASAGKPIPTTKAGESPLRQKIYLLGFRYLTNEKIPDEEITELREQIEAERQRRNMQFALSL